MAGITGPIPKRQEQRIRRNKPDVPITNVTAIGVVKIPNLNIDNPHPLVTDLYESIRNSAQSNWYEPSDWQIARVALHFLNQLIWSGGASGEKISAVHSMLTTLMLTEGDRRRLRMEITRNATGADASEVATVADMFRARLAGQG